MRRARPTSDSGGGVARARRERTGRPRPSITGRAKRISGPGRASARALAWVVGTSLALLAAFTAVASAAITNDPRVGEQWALENRGGWPMASNGPAIAGADIRASEAWRLARADTDVVVGVIDSGVDIAHRDLDEHLWVNTGEIAGNGVDDDGNGYVDDVHGIGLDGEDSGDIKDEAAWGYHGTALAGVILAETNNGEGLAGIADRARLMVIKAPAGGGDDGFRWAIDYAIAMKASVLNMSFGGPEEGGGECAAVSKALDAGIVVVASAGNDGLDNDTAPLFPASCPDPRLISVGASDARDERVSRSNWGRESVDLFAPGRQILTTTVDNGYRYVSGTSMAAANVSGAAALLRSVDPSASVDEIRAALIEGAHPAPDLAGRAVSGGRLDLVGALLALEATRPGRQTRDLPVGAPPAPAAPAVPSTPRALSTPTLLINGWSPYTRRRRVVVTVQSQTPGGFLISNRPSMTPSLSIPTLSTAWRLAAGPPGRRVVYALLPSGERLSRSIIFDATRPGRPTVLVRRLRGGELNVLWRGRDVGSGVAAVEVQEGRRGAPRLVVARSFRVTGDPARLRLVDRAGNRGPWIPVH